MAAKNKVAQAGAAAAGVWGNPLVRRVADDPELRANIGVAVEAARNAYGRLTNGKPPTKVVMDDRKFQKQVKVAGEALRDAGSALKQGPKRRKKRRPLLKLLLLAIVGAGVAIAVSEDLRSKVLDTLFGAEEEFDYTSTTAPSAAPTAGTAA